MKSKSILQKVKNGLAYSLFAASIACGGSSPTSPGIPEMNPTPVPTPKFPSMLLAGDIAIPGLEGAMATAKIIEKNPESRILTLGDNINVAGGGTSYFYENLFKKAWGPYLDRISPIPGNHDCEVTIDKIFCKPYYDFFGAASNPYLGYYSFDYGGVHFIALNDNIPVGKNSQQYAWLENDLKNKSKVCTVAAVHHPLFSSSIAPGNLRSESSHVKPLYELFYKYKGELIFTGDSHTYQRTGMINVDGNSDDNGFVQIISGTGGAELYELEPETAKTAKKFVKRGKAHGMTKIYLVDGIKIDYEFIPVDGQAFTDSGSMLCR